MQRRKTHVVYVMSARGHDVVDDDGDDDDDDDDALIGLRARGARVSRQSGSRAAVNRLRVFVYVLPLIPPYYSSFHSSHSDITITF